jgi:hypothetical protein
MWHPWRAIAVATTRLEERRLADRANAAPGGHGEAGLDRVPGLTTSSLAAAIPEVRPVELTRSFGDVVAVDGVSVDG